MTVSVKPCPGGMPGCLVLDTKGINVWCAAGKGTFGTEELVRRIKMSGLEKVVTHRELILPQLSGPGIAAHLVKKFSGFKVKFGPIRASDLPAYLEAGLQATPEMRVKTFPLRERIVLIPIELVAAFKAAILLMLVFFLLGGLGGPSDYWANATNYGFFAVIAILTGIISGAVLTPILLPFLPGRAFSLKGCVVGVVAAFVLLIMRNPDLAFLAGKAGSTLMAIADTGFSSISGHEFYRRLNVYLPFGSEKGNALCHASGNRRRRGRCRALAGISLYRVGVCKWKE